MNSSKGKTLTRGLKAIIVATILTAASGCVTSPVGGPHPFATMFDEYPPAEVQQLQRTSAITDVMLSKGPRR